jgi:hypothetical protein
VVVVVGAGRVVVGAEGSVVGVVPPDVTGVGVVLLVVGGGLVEVVAVGEVVVVGSTT